MCVETGTSSGPIPVAPPNVSLQSYSPNLQVGGCAAGAFSAGALGCK